MNGGFTFDIQVTLGKHGTHLPKVRSAQIFSALTGLRGGAGIISSKSIRWEEKPWPGLGWMPEFVSGAPNGGSNGISNEVHRGWTCRYQALSQARQEFSKARPAAIPRSRLNMDQPALESNHHGLRAVTNIETAEDDANMTFHGPLRNAQLG